MNSKLITVTKDFIKDLRSELNMIMDGNLFAISITGKGGKTNLISIALYEEVKAGIISRERYPRLYEEADGVLSCAYSSYKEISGVMVMLSDEYETSVFQDGNILRICNLDA